jgi:hypothetical protein
VLETVDGILVPGGFGIRGVEGKIEAVRFARERRVPYLGICLGLQCAVIEIARNLGGMRGANSSEFDPDTPFPVIDLLPDQRRVADKGGTMRLGLDPCRILRGSKAEQAYGDGLVFERHRHRYEVNNRYRRRLEEAGLVCSGTSPDGRLVEIIELPDHPWFVAGQFHPEFRSRPIRPHPLFRDFVGAATALADAREPVTRVERTPVDRTAPDGAGRDRDEAAAAPPPGRMQWPATRGEADPAAAAVELAAQRPSAPAARPPDVDLREEQPPPPEGRAPEGRPEGRDGPDPSVYRRGDGEPEPVPAGEPGHP